MATTLNRKTKSKRGGARPRSGRPPKADADQWTQITCRLRNDTLQALKDGAGGKFYGDFLQHHLDRYPLPTREEYEAQLRRGTTLAFRRSHHPRASRRYNQIQDRFWMLKNDDSRKARPRKPVAHA